MADIIPGQFLGYGLGFGPISGRSIPESLPATAIDLLKSLSWQRKTMPKSLHSVRDIPLEGQLRMEVRNLVEQVLILHRYNQNRSASC